MMRWQGCFVARYLKKLKVKISEKKMREGDSGYTAAFEELEEYEKEGVEEEGRTARDK